MYISARAQREVPPAIAMARAPIIDRPVNAPGPSVSATSGPSSAAQIAAPSTMCSASLSLVTLPSGPGPAPSTLRATRRRFSSRRA